MLDLASPRACRNRGTCTARQELLARHELRGPGGLLPWGWGLQLAINSAGAGKSPLTGLAAALAGGCVYQLATCTPIGFNRLAFR